MYNLSPGAPALYVVMLLTYWSYMLVPCWSPSSGSRDCSVSLELFHLNRQSPYISFTVEQEENNILPVLDINITKCSDGTLRTILYRKPTHTNQYLHFDSNHPLTVKEKHYAFNRQQSIVSIGRSESSS